jgi:acetolactate synthase I/II/III large subunit
MQPDSGAGIVARMLKRAGVSRVFTLSGNQILPLYDAFIDQGVSVVDTRHEAAAVHMADAWGALTGEPGVCLVTAGPGHLNAVGAAANALLAESRVLWLSGGSEISTRGMGGFQEIDQVGVASPVCKGALDVRSAADIPALLALAWRTALEGIPGPVHVTLPSDLLEDVCPAAGSGIDAVSLDPQRRSAPLDEVNRALNLLNEAERPLILVGPSVKRSLAGQRLRAFSERTGIPWFAIESARGLIDPALNGLGSHFRKADLILLIGKRDFGVKFAGPEAFDPAASLVHAAPVDSDLRYEPPPEVALEGDALSVLEQFDEGCEGYSWDVSSWRRNLEDYRRAARVELARLRALDDAPIHPMRVAAELRDVIPPDAILSQDGGEFSQWIRWEFADSGHETLVNGKLGMIGNGIPYAIGAALASPGRPSIAFLGDGTFGFHGMEFDTAVRHNLPIIAVVGNDAAWAAEKHRQVAIYGEDRVIASDLLPTRYDELVRALGGYGELVERPEDIGPAFQRALDSGKPACLNVMVASVPSPARLH